MSEVTIILVGRGFHLTPCPAIALVLMGIRGPVCVQSVLRDAHRSQANRLHSVSKFCRGAPARAEHKIYCFIICLLVRETATEKLPASLPEGLGVWWLNIVLCTERL